MADGKMRWSQRQREPPVARLDELGIRAESQALTFREPGCTSSTGLGLDLEIGQDFNFLPR